MPSSEFQTKNLDTLVSDLTAIDLAWQQSITTPSGAGVWAHVHGDRLIDLAFELLMRLRDSGQ